MTASRLQVMQPLHGLLEFHDPLHPENSPMHEWFFRSVRPASAHSRPAQLTRLATSLGADHPRVHTSQGLDHLVWVFGMFCAFAFPWFDRKLQALEELPTLTRHPCAMRTRAHAHTHAARSAAAHCCISRIRPFAFRTPRADFHSSLAPLGSVRSVVTAATLGLTIYWYVAYFSLPKRAYNKVHPYTSFIAIFTYLVLRNIVSGLRERHMHLFAWCGKITLETYILQVRVRTPRP